MVAKRMTIGKLENSIGVEVLIATIMISSDSTILNVNMMSSMNAGIGKDQKSEDQQDNGGSRDRSPNDVG